MKKLPLTSNIALISADYRLAPQTNIHEILHDTVDCVTYIRDVLPSSVGGRIDPRKFAVSGGSAGGWLALLAGIPARQQESGEGEVEGEGLAGVVLDPPVTCMVGIYPIVDVDTTFYTRKQRPVSYWPAGM
jgi:acetyl esterase/lipase